MRKFFVPALLLLTLLSSSQQLELSRFNPKEKISQAVGKIVPSLNKDGDSTNTSLTDSRNTEAGFDSSSEETKPTSDTAKEESGSLDLTPNLLPFETKYYTDYYNGPKNHKLFREVIMKGTNKRVHCSYVGDREIIAGLVGDSSTTINDALQAVMPTSYVEPINVTTEEVDDLIDDCINNPVDVPQATKPLLEKFIHKITQGAKDFAAYMFIFPGTKWCGAGDVARSYDDLGKQSATDTCCREHDHAGDSLARGETREGLKNPLFYTMTKCDKDNKFGQCLRDAETGHAGAVGTMFFNLLKTKCFDKRKEATCVKKLPLSPCQNYTYDENSEERLQIFDPTQFMPKSNIAVKAINDFLYKAPGVDNILKLF